MEYSHPTKCFYSGFSTNDLPMDVTEVAALGRPLDLGMLYDQRNESFISDSHLWDNHTLTSDRISWPQLKTHLKVLEDDSLQERCRAFEMSPMLRVKALCGLMELNGAAAFLNHPVQSRHQDRVTVHYKTTTRLDMISQRLLQEGAPASVINAATATHVIIAVFYGAQAFFVFDNERISSEKNTEMENVIKKMTTTLSARDVFSSLNENEKANTILYDCSLYTDLGDWKSPASFDKALEIYGSLPTLIGSKGERAVPLKVWLYPLKKLDKSSVHVALSGVSETLMHQAENILEHLRKQIRMCQDMITDYDNLTVITWFPALTEKLQNFSEFLQDYRTEFQRKTAKIIESKHTNEEEREKNLQELISNCDQSPFSQENTQHWLEKKETELVVLNGCRAANITIVKSQEELQRVINDPLMSSVFCFTSSMEAEDSFLTVLKQHIELMKKSTLIISKRINLEDSLQPLKPVCINEKVLSDLKVFIAAKETNEDPKQTKFIAASVPDDGYSEFSVQFYHEGRIVSRNLNLQRKTDLTQISQIKHNSVSLKINKKQNGNIEKYVIQYRALGDGMNNTTWKQIIFDSKSVKETCVISDLKSGKQYQLRYSVIEQDCMSNFSRIINIKTAFSPINGQPFVNKLNRSTLRLAWLKAETGEDCPVLRYMVEYKEAGLEGWSSVQTQGPECECTLTLPHSTCCRVRVSAVYGEGDTSKPSEETPVPVDVWRIKLSERKSSILLKVLKLQTEKKPVELIDCTDEESEVKGFLQCLPYISQLRFDPFVFYEKKRSVQFLLNLIISASEFDKTTGENYTELFTSVCSYTSFPFSENYTNRHADQCNFLLDLWSHVKDYETQTGRSVLPALQPIYQSAPAVWSIKLSERKSSILLEGAPLRGG
uniref:Si:ch211-281l24.3 n=1 Tax=Sinocyclocheilus rhinocerous TaxID=307959 RepID=A0A673M4R0_9TELE